MPNVKTMKTHADIHSLSALHPYPSKGSFRSGFVTGERPYRFDFRVAFPNRDIVYHSFVSTLSECCTYVCTTAVHQTRTTVYLMILKWYRYCIVYMRQLQFIQTNFFHRLRNTQPPMVSHRITHWDWNKHAQLMNYTSSERRGFSLLLRPK